MFLGDQGISRIDCEHRNDNICDKNKGHKNEKQGERVEAHDLRNEFSLDRPVNEWEIQIPSYESQYDQKEEDQKRHSVLLYLFDYSLHLVEDHLKSRA